MAKGELLVVSGPSGAGKGTICDLLRKAVPELGYSISMTTRQPRVGEVDGVNYFFKTVEQAQEMIARGQLLEYAEVFGNYYGTPREYVEEQLNRGRDVLLEIDVQGALQVKERFPESILIFIAPPSMEELNARLHKRGTDAEEVIQCRLAGAMQEISLADKYDYIVLNEVAETACEQLQSIMKAERNNTVRNYDELMALFENK